MEFGPRALGSRSILGDARSAEMQSRMNIKIKHRESFRPFAPSVLQEKTCDYFDINCASPYMLVVAPLKNNKRIYSEKEKYLHGFEKLKIKRSDIPAVTHVDYTARIQTVNEKDNPLFYKLIKIFEQISGCPVIINTSFNVRAEPIVCTPEDTYDCFMNTEMDYLILGTFLLAKTAQSQKNLRHKKEQSYELD